MKVLDLQCSQLHVFEGWFGSDADFHAQCARGLVTCPMCGDAAVQRKISAPRLARKSNAQPAARVGGQDGGPPSAREPGPEQEGASDLLRLHQAAYLRAVQHVLQHTEDVGRRFAEEARRIHYGETEARGIRGQATPQEKAALADEGIEVASLPLPKDMDGPLQ
ncbi:MAG: DUF1178 family protein [Comamonas sp.]